MRHACAQAASQQRTALRLNIALSLFGVGSACLHALRLGEAVRRAKHAAAEEGRPGGMAAAVAHAWRHTPTLVRCYELMDGLFTLAQLSAVIVYWVHQLAVAPAAFAQLQLDYRVYDNPAGAVAARPLLLRRAAAAPPPPPGVALTLQPPSPAPAWAAPADPSGLRSFAAALSSANDAAALWTVYNSLQLATVAGMVVRLFAALSFQRKIGLASRTLQVSRTFATLRVSPSPSPACPAADARAHRVLTLAWVLSRLQVATLWIFCPSPSPSFSCFPHCSASWLGRSRRRRAPQT